MAYEARVLNNPEFTGYLVKQKVKCGKKNCRCYREGKLHVANYVYYRVYFQDHETDNSTGYISKLKKKYIKKSEVSKWHRKLALNKAYKVIGGLSLDSANDKELCNLEGNKFLIKSFDKYRIRRDGAPRIGLDASTNEHFFNVQNRYLRFRHEWKLLENIIKAQKRPEHLYDRKARSIAAIKGRIGARQRYYANKHNIWS